MSAAPEPRPGKAAERARATRAALVELAAELFAERGYVQTSIRDITRRGEVTSGAIYGHFRNKADLLAEAISVRTDEELEAQAVGADEEADYIETLTRLGGEYPKRRRMRALIVQGAAAAQTDEETRTRLREEQLEHLEGWIRRYEESRDEMGIHPSVDVRTFVLYSWAVELGLGVLEGIGIEPRTKKSWADIQNRLGRAMQLPPDDAVRPRPHRKASRRRS
jgi:AcrR family transcriptional regulator